MKNFISTICLGAILIFLGSCQKDLNEVEVIYSDSIAGKWELRKVIGGFRGIQPGKDYPAGNGNIRIFSDSTYQTYWNHISDQSGNYSLGKDYSNATKRITDFVMLSSNEKIYFEIANNIMTMYRGELVYDGTIEKYERIANYR
jgi:hypothetical protein